MDENLLNAVVAYRDKIANMTETVPQKYPQLDDYWKGYFTALHDIVEGLTNIIQSPGLPLVICPPDRKVH